MFIRIFGKRLLLNNDGFLKADGFFKTDGLLKADGFAIFAKVPYAPFFLGSSSVFHGLRSRVSKAEVVITEHYNISKG
jgi:hypothetical protein